MYFDDDYILASTLIYPGLFCIKCWLISDYNDNDDWNIIDIIYKTIKKKYHKVFILRIR